jgi:hypothetical protein
MSVHGMKRKPPFREDLMVLAVTAIIVFSLYGAADYPRTVGNITHTNGPGGGGQHNTNTTHPVEEQVVDTTGSTNEGQSTNVDMKVPWANLTWVNVTLTWVDDVGNNDEFSVKVSSGGAELGKGDGTTGTISVNIQSPASGNYTAVVTCVTSPGLVGANPFHVVDKGNSWSLKATAVHEVQG